MIDRIALDIGDLREGAHYAAESAANVSTFSRRLSDAAWAAQEVASEAAKHAARTAAVVHLEQASRRVRPRVVEVLSGYPAASSSGEKVGELLCSLDRTIRNTGLAARRRIPDRDAKKCLRHSHKRSK